MSYAHSFQFAFSTPQWPTTLQNENVEDRSGVQKEPSSCPTGSEIGFLAQTNFLGTPPSTHSRVKHSFSAASCYWVKRGRKSLLKSESRSQSSEVFRIFKYLQVFLQVPSITECQSFLGNKCILRLLSPTSWQKVVASVKDFVSISMQTKFFHYFSYQNSLCK